MALALAKWQYAWLAFQVPQWTDEPRQRDRAERDDVARFQSTGVLMVGPREPPRQGQVWVWIDSGSGPGHKISVHPGDLTLSELDDGQGRAAIYNLRTHHCQG